MALATGLAAVAAVYLAQHAWCAVVDIPKEPYMAALYLGKTPLQIGLFLLTALTIAPLAEELAFRHFLLGSFPHRRSNAWAAIGTVVTAFAFAVLHMSQYRYPSTIALMVVLGGLFAAARIKTGGLVLPVALHIEAVALGLLLNELH
jgi:uncharacterized protein